MIVPPFLSPLPPPALVSIQIVDGSAGAELFEPDSAEASWVVGLETYEFAHEAPVWNKQDGELFFASNRLTRNDGGGQKIDLRTISLSTGLSRPIKPRPDILISKRGDPCTSRLRALPRPPHGSGRLPGLRAPRRRSRVPQHQHRRDPGHRDFLPMHG